MLKVLPVQSKEQQEDICKKCGVKYNPDTLAYVATVDDRLAGVSQFRVTAEGGLIFDLAPALDFDNFEAMFVMGRGTLNFIDLCENHTCYADDNSASERLLLAIGFKRKDDKYFCDMTGMFDGHCSGEKEKK